MINEAVPPSLVEIQPILRVANEIQLKNPRVAYLCRLHAFGEAHKLDPASRGYGVRQFKNALLHRLDREDAVTLGGQRNRDSHEMQAFYVHYYANYIQGFQNADNADGTRLTKACQTASVLFEVLKVFCSFESVEVAEEILKAHKEVVEKAEMYSHNVHPLEPEISDQALQRHPEMKQQDHLKIPLHAIKNCTQDFDERNFIGKGGYGRVYTGVLTWADHVNQLVAVKRLDAAGFQGRKEFHTELAMLSQYQHENIVSLLGFCDDNKEMILIYEYASHGSLDTYLRNTPVSDGPSWPQLLNICIGVASAINYLHNHVAEKHRIIHRDIKSANILVDENWNAKLADFGLARIGLANQQNTFVITNLAGTHGYCDPQYERTGFLTKESDVFSFGVVLFEVLCRRLACVYDYHDERRFLYHLARTCYKNGELHKIIDHRIRKDIKPTTLLKYSAIAYQCLQENREDRPTITEVVFQLKEALKIQVEDEIVPYGLVDDMIQHGLEDEILQDGLHSGGDKEKIIQGRLERLKSKLKYILSCLLKKQ